MIFASVANVLANSLDNPAGGKTKMTIKESAQAAIKAIVASGGKDQVWGVDQSAGVINAMYKNETGDVMPAEMLSFVRSLCNPSAFRKELEKAGVLNVRPTTEAKVNKLTDGLLG